MTRNFRKSVLALVAASICCVTAVRADDIDLYTGGEQITGVATNVLIVLDNTSNFSATNQGWTTLAGANAAQGAIEAQTLIKVLRDLPVGSLNVGLMQYSDKGGGYPIFAVRENTDGTGNTINNLAVFDAVANQIRNNVGSPEFKGPASGDYDELLNSVFRYFNGFVPRTTTGGRTDESQQGDLRDYPGNGSPVLGRATLGNHGYTANLVSSPGAAFAAPVDAKLGCAKNFVIFIGNGFPSSSATDAKTRLTNAGALFSPAVTPVTSGIAIADALSQVAPYWTRFMREFGVKSVVDDGFGLGGKLFNPIQTYTIDVCKNNCDNNQRDLLQSMADEGGGRYFRSTSEREIEGALKLIFAEIQAVNSQFAAAALPVSVNARGTFENQVYIGVFRPDGQSLPRWYGNLKGYKFGGFCDWDQDGIVDADEAISEAVGNNRDACRLYCDMDLDGNFSPTVDIGVNDPSLAPATCAALNTTQPNPADTTPLDTTDPGSFLASEVGTLPVDRFDIFLSDQSGELAEDQTGGTGFIRQDAVSYWTHPSDFWAFLRSTASNASDSPDGPNVERGGAAQKLRDQLVDTASATPLADVNNRRVYTCIGCAAGTGLGGNSNYRFSTANSLLTNGSTGLLDRNLATFPLATLARSGDTVTVTASGPLSNASGTLTNGARVSISGASVADYNQTVVTATNVAVGNATTPGTFQFTVDGLEEPPVSATGSLSLSAPRVISLSYSAGRALATGDALGLADGDTVTVSGAGPFYDGQAVIADVLAAATGSFTFALKVPAPATFPGSTTAGPKTYSNLGIQHDPANPLQVQVRTGSDLTVNPESGRFAVGNSVTINGAVPVSYNGTKTIVSCSGTFDADTFCFNEIVPSVSGSYLGGSALYPIAITRALGSTVVNGRFTSVVPGSLVNGTAGTITGTGISSYDQPGTVGAWNVATSTFTFLPNTAIALSPAASASGGTATVLIGDYVAPSKLINWVLGQENGDEDENQDGFRSGWRASAHGDVLHSRPLMLNYDDPATPAVELGIVGFYGGNDGILRAIRAGTNATDGGELWAFIPEEFIPDPTTNDGIKRLYHNTKPILYPNLACNMSPAPEQRDYFWDGVISSNSGAESLMNGKRIIYAAMRRGGRAVYALDVTNPAGNADPANFVPTFAWKVTNASAGFASFGQSWSEPRVVTLKSTNASAVGPSIPVLVMGGGFDPTEDDRPTGAVRGDGSSTIGRGVYLINPETGPGAVGSYLHLLPTLPAGTPQYSIPADVTPVDSDNDGFVDRIYAVDSGGNVFRWAWDTASASPFDPSAWTFKWVASLGGTGVEARKFLSRMAFMPSSYKGVSGITLLFGSGDREKPLPNRRVDKNTLSCVASQPLCPGYYPDGYFGSVQVQDKFFAVTDIDTVPVNGSGVADFTYPINLAELFGIVTGGTVASYSEVSGKAGWYFDLLNNLIFLNGSACPRGEEKLVDLPVFSGGFIRFATNSPVLPDTSTGSCSNLGEAREYAINPLTGLGLDVQDGDAFSINNFSTPISGGGLPPSITSGVVQIGERFVKFDTRGAGGTSRDPVNASSRRQKVYWFYRAD